MCTTTQSKNLEAKINNLRSEIKVDFDNTFDSLQKSIESLRKQVINKELDTGFESHHKDSSLDGDNHQPTFILGSHQNTLVDMYLGIEVVSWKCINLIIMTG